MKSYLVVLTVMVLCFVLIEIGLMKLYRPTPELLNRTTLIHGKLRFATQGRGEIIAELNGIPLMCRANFIGAQEQCIARISVLSEGSDLTVAVANVRALARTVQLAMTIAVNGTEVYATTPEKVIEEWTRSSYRGLWAGPVVVLFLFFLMPILVSARFRAFLLSSVT